MYYADIWKENFNNDLLSLNDLYERSKTESYNVPLDYFGVEDRKRLVIF